MRMTLSVLVLASLVAVAPSAPLPDERAATDRTINLLGPRPIEEGSLLFVVTHRARQSVGERTGHDFFGLDAGGVKIGLGLRWSPVGNLDVGVFRVNGTAEIFDSVEWDVRSLVFGQEHVGVTLGLRAGVSWFVQRDLEDASGAFGQVILGRTFGRLGLTAGVLSHTDSSGDRKASTDDDWTVAAFVAGEVRLAPGLTLAAEVVPPLGGYHEAHPTTSLGVKVYTHGHTFSLVLSTTQYGSADGVITGAWRTWDEPIVGFAITRDIHL